MVHEHVLSNQICCLISIPMLSKHVPKCKLKIVIFRLLASRWHIVYKDSLCYKAETSNFAVTKTPVTLFSTCLPS